MNKNNYFTKIIFTVVLVCFTSVAVVAQEDFGDDTVDNPPATSIDFYTPLLLVGAIGLGYVLLNKRVKSKG